MDIEENLDTLSLIRKEFERLKELFKNTGEGVVFDKVTGISYYKTIRTMFVPCRDCPYKPDCYPVSKIRRPIKNEDLFDDFGSYCAQTQYAVGDKYDVFPIYIPDKYYNNE